MSFRVNPNDISRYGNMVGNASAHMLFGIGYVQGQPDLETDNGRSKVWEKVASLHETHKEKSEAALKAYRKALTSSQQELVKSARYYSETDAEEAAALDATYPRSKRGADGTDATPLVPVEYSLVEVEEPLDHLKGTGDSSFVERLVGDRYNATFNNKDGGLGALRDSVGHVLDSASVSTMINEVIKIATGRDLLGDFAQSISGDWDTFANNAERWQNLSSFCESVSKNIRSGNGKLAGSWGGKASDAAYVYFDSLADKISDAADNFAELYSFCDEIAGDISNFINIVKMATSAAIDLALLMIIDMIVAAKAAASVVGAPLAAAAKAAFVVKAFALISLSQKVETALAGLFLSLNLAGAANVEKLEQRLKDISSFPVPRQGYDNELV